MTDDRDLAGLAASHADRPPAAAGVGRAPLAIGPARAGELLTLAQLQRRAFRPRLAYGLGTIVVLWLLPHVRFLVARLDGRVVGCAIGDRDNGNSRVINLAVDPDARRQGVGRALLRALEAA
ncbi:MAG: GNAT family N-acetyltransferase, partial [Chloroflexota bacterium]|nr:GNAT family N-acetyltransferase [Chloroflexota bacterium]